MRHSHGAAVFIARAATVGGTRKRRRPEPDGDGRSTVHHPAYHSGGTNVRRLRTLGALGDVELDPLVVVETAVALGRDSRVVREHVGTPAIRRDEPEALLCVEPLDCADRHVLLLSRLDGDHTVWTPRHGVDHLAPTNSRRYEERS